MGNTANIHRAGTKYRNRTVSKEIAVNEIKWEYLRRICERKGTTISNIIRKLIDGFIESELTTYECIKYLKLKKKEGLE
jgi:macrodomain Ter protein organizer (MatP/YcbG family)